MTGPLVGSSTHSARRSFASHVIGWTGLVLVGMAWVAAHYNVAGSLRRLDRTWDPPPLLEPVDRVALLVVGAVASVAFVTVVQVLFRTLLARRVDDVDPRRQVLVFLVPVVVCLWASRRFGVMTVGPLLLLVLNLAQLARRLPPSTPASEVFGWAGRLVGRGLREGGRLGSTAARRVATRRDDRPAPPFS